MPSSPSRESPTASGRWSPATYGEPAGRFNRPSRVPGTSLRVLRRRARELRVRRAHGGVDDHALLRPDLGGPALLLHGGAHAAEEPDRRREGLGVPDRGDGPRRRERRPVDLDPVAAVGEPGARDDADLRPVTALDLEDLGARCTQLLDRAEQHRTRRSGPPCR